MVSSNSCLPPTFICNQQIDNIFVPVWVYHATRKLSITYGELLILGDLNLHVDKPSDPDASQFFSLLYTIALTQRELL